MSMRYDTETYHLVRAVEDAEGSPRPSGAPVLLVHLDNASHDIRRAARHVTVTPSGKTVGALQLSDCDVLLLDRGVDLGDRMVA